MPMTASIVINTYNRARSLERLLPSLDHLSGGVVFEVVVVNGPSTDDTEAVLARCADRLTIARCPAPNLSMSRNVGIRAASGDVVVFIDDDALPDEPAWLERLVAVFDHDPERRVGAAGGPSRHADTDWMEFAGGWTSDYAEQRFADRCDVVPGDPRWFRRTVGNNSAFRRSALVAIGGFDENIPYYLDEADVCLRLARAGFETVYVPDAAVRHYPAPSPIGPPFIRNRRIIARSDTYYCLKNGEGGRGRRLLETLRRAPRKHFVRELPELRASGRIGRADLWRLRWHWLRGVAAGIVQGLWTPRAATVREGVTRPLVPFARPKPEAPMSIALLSRRLPPDPHAGGVARYTYDLARGLHERGHHVTIVTEGDSPIRRERLGFEILGVHPVDPPPGFSQTPVLAQNLAYADAVRACLEARSATRPFDVVHATNWGLEALGVAQAGRWPLTLMLVTPLESVIAAEGWPVTTDLAANIALDQWVVERADRVVAPSAGVLDTYARRDGWGGREVAAVPLGTVPAQARARRDGPCRRLLFVGRHERRKGIDVLLAALPVLLERHPDWQCDLVGNNSVPSGVGETFESRFREAHADASWADRVTFHGPVSDERLSSFYADADVFVAPSRFESFGLIYLEAMQHGVPVVGAAVGGVPDVVTDGEDGLLVPPGDAAALVAALDRLMSDESLRTRLGTGAARAVRTTKNHLAMADRMLAQYGTAVAGHTAAPTRRDRLADLPLAECVMTVLERGEATRGLSLACRASTAFEQGRHGEAAGLIDQALLFTSEPDLYTMGVELALAEDDPSRAAALAVRGFDTVLDRASGDQRSEVCLVFAALLLTRAGHAELASSRWRAWRRDHAATLPTDLLAAALAAIRTKRDATALVLLEACRALAGRDRRLTAQVHYHLGSALKRMGRLADAVECFSRITDRDLTLLPGPLQGALHFHLGELDLQAGRPASAVTRFAACLAHVPDHGRARVLLEETRAAVAA